MRKSAFPRPVDDIVPYETPSLLVDTVENVTENSVVCSVIVGNRDCVCYSEDKELPVMALLELMAQTFSVWNVFMVLKEIVKNVLDCLLMLNVLLLLVTVTYQKEWN